jgi:hypothetical protein
MCFGDDALDFNLLSISIKEIQVKIILKAIFTYLLNKKKMFAWAPVAHTYNPSYLGGRDQENQSLKPVLDK